MSETAGPSPPTDAAPRSPARMRPPLHALFPASLALTAVVAIFYLLEVVLGGPSDHTLRRLGALRHDLVVDRGEYFRVFTAAFLHGGVMHLVLNGLALIQLAPLVELMWGSSRLLVVYLLSALGGTVLSALMQPMYSVGASGAILGLAGLLLGATWFGREPSRSRLRALLGRRLLVSVALTFALGVGLSIWLPIVDNYGHLGGFAAGLGASTLLRDPDRPPGRAPKVLAGLLCALFLAAFGWMAASDRAPDSLDERVVEHQRFLRAAPDHPMTELSTYELEHELVAAGRHDDARAVLLRRLQVAPTDEQALAHLARSFRLHGVAPDLLGAARAFAERALAAQVPDGRATLLDAAAQLHALAGDTAEASRLDGELLALFERAVKENPDEPIALNGLAWTLLTCHDAARRDPARAFTLAQRAVELLESSFMPMGADGRLLLAATRDTVAEALLQLGRVDEALLMQRHVVDVARAEGLTGDELLELTRRLEAIQAARAP